MHVDVEHFTIGHVEEFPPHTPTHCGGSSGPPEPDAARDPGTASGAGGARVCVARGRGTTPTPADGASDASEGLPGLPESWDSKVFATTVQLSQASSCHSCHWAPASWDIQLSRLAFGFVFALLLPAYPPFWFSCHGDSVSLHGVCSSVVHPPQLSTCQLTASAFALKSSAMSQSSAFAFNSASFSAFRVSGQ